MINKLLLIGMFSILSLFTVNAYAGNGNSIVGHYCVTGFDPYLNLNYQGIQDITATSNPSLFSIHQDFDILGQDQGQYDGTIIQDGNRLAVGSIFSDDGSTAVQTGTVQGKKVVSTWTVVNDGDALLGQETWTKAAPGSCPGE